jgi:hypothetical protein
MTFTVPPNPALTSATAGSASTLLIAGLSYEGGGPKAQWLFPNRSPQVTKLSGVLPNAKSGKASPPASMDFYGSQGNRGLREQSPPVSDLGNTSCGCPLGAGNVNLGEHCPAVGFAEPQLAAQTIAVYSCRGRAIPVRVKSVLPLTQIPL